MAICNLFLNGLVNYLVCLEGGEVTQVTRTFCDSGKAVVVKWRLTPGICQVCWIHYRMMDDISQTTVRLRGTIPTPPPLRTRPRFCYVLMLVFIVSSVDTLRITIYFRFS
jgi:hypothetical protein